MRCSSVARLAITEAVTRIAAYYRIMVPLPLPATTWTRIDDIPCCDTLRESEGHRGGILKCKLSVIVLVCAIFLAAGSARAHHSPSSIFDMSQKFTLTGTLTQVDWVNPHIAVYIDVKKADGTGVDNWKFESAPPSWLKRVGVNSADFKKAIGQVVTVE